MTALCGGSHQHHISWVLLLKLQQVTDAVGIWDVRHPTMHNVQTTVEHSILKTPCRSMQHVTLTAFLDMAVAIY